MIRVEQDLWHDDRFEPVPLPPAPQRLVLAFGSVATLRHPSLGARLNRAYPGAVIAGCSTAGEITADGVSDDALTVTALTFDHTRIRLASGVVPAMSSSRVAGKSIAATLRDDDLAHILVLSDGVHVNGSALVAGLREGVGRDIAITGGLAGDAGKFTETLVFSDGGSRERAVVGIGLYGDRLRVGHGSVGGWTSFGPLRQVTASDENLLIELDGRPALEVYESYLGEDAANLPGSGLLFPLALVSASDDEGGLIRTLLAVDRERGTLTFAGDIAAGSLVRLMHATIEDLVIGSQRASEAARQGLAGHDVQAALLVSCVGRRLLMGRHADREIEAASDVLGHGTCLTGFYSNGEISPFVPSGVSELHNQTMTVTAMAETA